ncbi:hypothetical protein CCMA1212_005601 [Trichoderma ghanense]|uniref:Uncharacterized protein n=1 Tax=Trichoderma ghanense TaxID=65468 RepID=A0ABY2H2L6_9HYPO
MRQGQDSSDDSPHWKSPSCGHLLSRTNPFPGITRLSDVRSYYWLHTATAGSNSSALWTDGMLKWEGLDSRGAREDRSCAQDSGGGRSLSTSIPGLKRGWMWDRLLPVSWHFYGFAQGHSMNHATSPRLASEYASAPILYMQVYDIVANSIRVSQPIVVGEGGSSIPCNSVTFLARFAEGGGKAHLRAVFVAMGKLQTASPLLRCVISSRQIVRHSHALAFLGRHAHLRIVSADISRDENCACADFKVVCSLNGDSELPYTHTLYRQLTASQ